MKLGLIFSLSLFASAIAKTSYLPPLALENIISEEVSQFLAENSEKSVTTTKQIHRDILGRKNSNSNTPANYVIRDEARMNVHIVYLGSHKDIKSNYGRFEIAKNSATKVWLNDVELSESDYDELINEQRDDYFIETGFRASLTASQIENILNGPQKVYIGKDIPPS